MVLDQERVVKKVAYIREQVAAIEDLVENNSRQRIISDPWLQKGIKYSLQTAIEAMIDISYHVAAKKYNYPPKDARDALRLLRENNVISPAEYATYTAMIGFRNRLVHGYLEVSPERLYNIISKQMEDFERFVKSILTLLTEGTDSYK